MEEFSVPPMSREMPEVRQSQFPKPSGYMRSRTTYNTYINGNHGRLSPPKRYDPSVRRPDCIDWI